MLSVRQHAANGGWVAGEFIGDHDARFIADVVNNLPEESFGRVLITPRLHQDVQHHALLIDRPPQPMAFAIDLQHDLVEVPLVARPRSSPTSPAGKDGTELGAPLTDRLMADDDATLSEQVLNVAEAEVKPKVQPDSMNDDLGREAVASVRRPYGRGRGDGHQATLIADRHST